jgi:hypothetical protein
VNLDLPPRRPLPFDVAARMRARLVAGMSTPAAGRFDRIRSPLAVAAGVTVLAGGAMIVAQSTHGSGSDPLAAATRTTSPTSTSTQRGSGKPTSAVRPPLRVVAPRTEDLDRCATVAHASPRAHEFPPRSAWQPLYAVEAGGHRITAYRENGTKPGFCDTTATTATVSDPSAEPMSLDERGGDPGHGEFSYEGLYLSAAGVLAGYAPGVDALRFFVGRADRAEDLKAVMRENLFVVELGPLAEGDFIGTTALDSAGKTLAGSGIRFTASWVRPVGATGNA